MHNLYNVPSEPERAAEAREARRSCEFLEICQNVKSIPEGLCILLSGGVVILTRTDPLPSLILGNQSVAFGWTPYLLQSIKNATDLNPKRSGLSTFENAAYSLHIL